MAALTLALIGGLLIAAHPWFLAHDAYPTLQSNLGYSIRSRDLNCEIVLYGDSTALTGLDPAIIQARTGLKTCNLAETAYVQKVIGSYYPLDAYLAHNSRPRFIYSMWAAYDFHPQTQRWVDHGSEGIEYALLYDNGPWLWKGLLRHPSWIVNFDGWVGQLLVKDLTMRITGEHQSFWARAGLPRDDRGGFWQMQLPSESRCGPVSGVQDVSRQRAIEDIAAFKRRYSVGGTQVLVDVSPVADCIANRDQLVDATSGLGDNRLQFLPVQLFNVNDIHFVPEGSRIVSNEAADQILAILRKDEAGRTHRARLDQNAGTFARATQE